MRTRIESLAFVLIAGLLVTISAAGAADVQSTPVPLCFIQNNGQLDEQALYFVDAPGFTLYLTETGEVLFPVDTVSPVLVTYEGSNQGFQVAGQEPLTGTSNFFIGNNPQEWVTDVPTYASVRYSNLYDGISLVYSAGTGILKREFIVDPEADPADIVMVYSGQESLTLDETGTILIGTSGGILYETAPVCYQLIDGRQIDVPCRYSLSGDSVSFTVGGYDPAFPLVIDPILDFSTYFGGTADDTGAGIGLDDSGNVYIVGSTQSTGLPLPNAPVFQEHLNGSWDIFVAKMSPDGSTLVYSTYIGGNRTDMAGGIAVNNATGEVFFTGYTLSPNYPDTVGTALVNLEDVVVTGLDTSGSALTWSRYFSGNKTDQGTGIAFDSGGNPVVVGITNSDTFPGITFSNSYGGSYDAFVAKFGIASGLYLDNPRYLGGSGGDYGYGIDVDSAGNIWVTGSTKSTNFPTTAGVFRTTSKGKSDVFITEFASTLGAPLRSTYLGGTEDDFGRGIAIGPGDYPYVTGYTESGVTPISLFPIKPYFFAFQLTFAGGKYDAFITKMENDLSALNYSTYLGGNYEDRAYAIAVDDAGNAYVTGMTDSTNFPTMNPYQAFRDGLVTDVFVTQMNTTGTGLVYSTYFGGTYYDEGRGLAISPDGLNITFTGYTESINFPIMNAYQPYLAGYPPVRKNDAFISKILKIPPVANFTGTPLTGCSPLTVNFTDTSTNTPTSWLWEFGDGNTSTDQNPSHTYYNTNATTAVNFTVNLTVCNADGCDNITKANYTRVCPNLYWDLIANQTRGCVGQNATIQFNGMNITGGPINLTTWYFDFGDNTTIVPTAYIHTYTQTGIYNVSLFVENECCNNTTVNLSIVDIRAKPVADFFAVPTRGLVPLDVDFFDNSTGVPSSWDWFLGAGQGNSTDQNPEHLYTTKGAYRVTLTACNFCGCDTETKPQYIRVGDPNLTFVPDSLIVPTNDTTPIDLYFERAENGLSGFDLNLFWGDTVHGNITGVKFPPWAANQTVIGTLPGPIIQVRGVDLFNAVTPGATNIYLGTFNLTGITPTYPSSMWFNVSVNELDDNFGNPVYTNEIPADITVVRLLPFPGKINPPTDPYGDQLYWDVNGNGVIDFSDVVTYFQNMQWIRNNQYVPFFDYNMNGLIDFADLIMLFHEV